MSTRNSDRPVGALLDLLARRGARQQQHQVGMFRARGPDLLAVDDVVVAFLARAGAQTERVGARGRFRHTKSLQAQFAAGDLGQVVLLLRVAAVAQDGAHDVHLRMTGGAVAAGGMNLFHDGSGGADREPAAAVFLRDEGCEIAGLGQGGDEFFRIGPLAIQRAPVFAGEFGAKRAHALADVGEAVVVFQRSLTHAVLIYAAISARPLLIATTSRSTARARKLSTAPSRQISVRIVSPG